MRLLASSAVVAAFLLAPTWAQAQTIGANPQSQRGQCRALYLPIIGSSVKVAFKSGRKIKGKLIARRDDDFDVSRNKKTETIVCSDVAHVKETYRFGSLSKSAIGYTLFFAGYVVAAPGLIMRAYGAEKVGWIVAAPGVAMMDLGYHIAEGH